MKPETPSTCIATTTVSSTALTWGGALVRSITEGAAPREQAPGRSFKATKKEGQGSNENGVGGGAVASTYALMGATDEEDELAAAAAADGAAQKGVSSGVLSTVCSWSAKLFQSGVNRSHSGFTKMEPSARVRY